MKQRGIAAVLALFLGGLGVHKFYLNQVTAGVLYLVFSWTLIPALLALIDFVRYASMSNEVFAAKYSLPGTPGVNLSALDNAEPMLKWKRVLIAVPIAFALIVALVIVLAVVTG
ncbi:MAG: TM2 domain-containing protein [Candidatus Paceibacterota bacterium]|jgi:TM2 domain-containing membrane protein YozV